MPNLYITLSQPFTEIPLRGRLDIHRLRVREKLLQVNNIAGNTILYLGIDGLNQNELLSDDMQTRKKVLSAIPTIGGTPVARSHDLPTWQFSAIDDETAMDNLKISILGPDGNEIPASVFNGSTLWLDIEYE